VQCAKGHGFDGWFRDSAAFDAQASHGLVECPACGDTTVSRALMAPAVPKKGRDVTAPAPAPAPRAPAEAPAAIAGERLPDHVRAMLQRLRAEVEKNCDYVGEQFADEARRIHRGETDRRGIYGETTPEQAEALSDEGIEVNRIPWVPRADG
jgi:hypothetical protein